MKRLFFCLLFLLSLSVQASCVVVVNKSSVINQLDTKQVADIFLAKTSYFPNGEKALPIELKNSEYRSQFYQHLSGKTNSQLNAYWTALIFTGKGRPPKRLDGRDNVISRLENQQGTISYIDINELTDELKVVYSFPKI